MTSPFKKVAYYSSWSIYSSKYPPQNIPAANLTHLMYAFANIANGCVVLGDSWADTQISYGDKNKFNGIGGAFGYLNSPTGDFRAKNPSIKTLISVGGWTWSKSFSTCASTPQSRSIFAKSIADFVTKYGFDGVDIDWEYPVGGGDPGNTTSPADGVNYVLLLNEIRNELNRVGGQNKQYQLSVAMSSISSIAGHVNIKAVSDVVDFINIMSYDFSGPWSQTTQYNSNLFLDANRSTPLSVDGSVTYYLSQGANPRKLVCGTPFCGKLFSNVSLTKNQIIPGLNEKYRGVPGTSEFPGMVDNGIISYTGLQQLMVPNNQYGFVTTYDNTAQTASMYSSKLKVWISFENETSLISKCNYVRGKSLGGLMIWELSQDKNNSLAPILSRNL
ncbi:hypothetical protein BB559_003405 [Furculomyces boomerangus]|uniref:GH18 domain-containing protein n=2 Tax=Harpellales TaxID=61421 RepID=A0A2T9YLJ6_9FUNG|nr:hypothetical protein BB559_003405 [Furculomyces boomerangus]PVZ99467.1 hypothetical protein BB558_004411 [Smittium angustum]